MNWASFAQEFLEHVNPYTKRAYKDEPGIPLVSLINEGNLGMRGVHLLRANIREAECQSGDAKIAAVG